MDTSFLPEGYKEPVKSNYMKFQDGSNVFRVLAPATVGWEYWTEEVVDGVKKNTPHRVTKEETIPMDKVVVNKFGNLNVSFFWAFPVYNWSADRIQILQITQAGIRKDITAYVKNAKWGNPTAYNLEVTKSKEGDKTVYGVLAEPKEELPKEIQDKFSSMKIDMDEWMKGGEPFSLGSKEEKIDTKKIADQVPF